MAEARWAWQRFLATVSISLRDSDDFPRSLRASRDVFSIDLFCGCGGFSLGLKQAGFTTLAAIDIDRHATRVFRTNFPEVPHVLCEDLIEFGPDKLRSLLDGAEPDVIVGGPPCQGFSHVRQVDGANHGPRLVADERRTLYRQFLRYVEFFKPPVFVMENVLGIRSADGGRYFAAVQSEARQMGYRVHGQVIKAADFGVPQKRQRQLIIGTRTELLPFKSSLVGRTHSSSGYVSLGEAIGDLPALEAGEGDDQADYDLKLRRRHIARYGRHYIQDVLDVSRAGSLTAHKARPHSERDIRDFCRLREGETAKEAIDRGEDMEFPYDREVFHDRYTRQHRDEPCSTIVAHLSKDGLMFIHPTQDRTLTPREAARIQSFPDWFEFPVARTHQFRLIGNAVPPLVAKSIGYAVGDYLRMTKHKGREATMNTPIPSDSSEAQKWITALLDERDRLGLRRVPHNIFLRGWASAFYLMPGSHPDSFWDYQSLKIAIHSDEPMNEDNPLGPVEPVTGWPINLLPVLQEAWGRHKKGELEEDEMYPFEAQRHGLERLSGLKA